MEGVIDPLWRKYSVFDSEEQQLSCTENDFLILDMKSVEG